MFYYGSTAMIIRRPDTDDDNKMVGDTSKDNWLGLVRAAKECGDRGQMQLYVDN